ncbi:hypothetical protein ColKHC_13662 [Colletotrichum higginsianum]|nr:hypothetical protein ColKHC_13662 [Colletotrichum higginsianum]
MAGVGRTPNSFDPAAPKLASPDQTRPDHLLLDQDLDLIQHSNPSSLVLLGLYMDMNLEWTWTWDLDLKVPLPCVVLICYPM